MTTKPSQAKPSQAKPSQAKPSTAGNRTLNSAKGAKKDEFYTQLSDISNELKHYKTQLRGKTIFCNCDDPFESNFFKYFALNFNTLGLNKLIATSYKNSPIVGAHLALADIKGLKPESKQPYAIEICGVPDQNNDGAIDITDVTYLLKHNANTARLLNGDDNHSGGDFRSRECVEFLKQADIIITNPPFSLFREYVELLDTYDKNFLIVGNKNAITYKEIFLLIKKNRVWVGATPMGVDMLFDVPEEYAKTMISSGKEGSSYKIINGVLKGRSPSIWFTNMDNQKRHEKMTLYKKYAPAEYPKYDNYDAIEVSKVAEIPIDYDGAMGVPISFLDKYNPDQFELLGSNRGINQDAKGIYGRSSMLNGKETFKRLFIQRRT